MNQNINNHTTYYDSEPHSSISNCSDSDYSVRSSYITNQNYLNKLSIGCLNVCGLKRRTQYPEFVELVKKHDILCVCETKLDKEDVISCDGYTFINEPRKQAYIRKSGGLGFFYP